MALDQYSLDFLAAAAAAAGPDATPMHEQTPEEARLGALASIDAIGPGPEVHSSEDIQLRSSDDADEFTIRVLKPSEDPQGVFLYIHGGGWVVSDIAAYDAIGRQLAVDTGHTVVLVNYRKAPEAPFPAPVDDCWTALNWIDLNRGQLAAPGTPLIVGGDSAGGNLTAAMTLRARDAGGPKIDLQVLIYPVTDADFTRDSYLAEDNQTLLPTEAMQWFWDHYAPVDQRSHQEAAPLQAESLADLPEAYLVVAEHDVLRDEGEAYGQRLAAEGVRVDSHVFPGQMHGFISFFNILPAGNQLVERISAKVRSHSNQLAGASKEV